MSANLLNLYGQQYSTNVQLLLQQRMSKFTPYVMTGSHQGEQASPVDQIGKVAMNPVTGRFQTKTRTDAPVDRRWVQPSDFDLQQLVDKFDKLKMLSDPKNAYVQNTVAAVNRQKDDVIIDSFFGTSLTGKTGTTSTTFPTSTSTNVVGVSTGGTTSNINVAKIKKAVELLLSNDVDLENEELACAIGPKQNTALLNEIEVISADFTPAERPKIDSKGRVMSFLGINFVHSNRLDTGTDDAAGTSRAIPLWCKSGMHLGLWLDAVYDVREAKEFKGNPWEVYAHMSLGATRIEEGKIIRIWCRE